MASVILSVFDHIKLTLLDLCKLRGPKRGILIAVLRAGRQRPCWAFCCVRLSKARDWSLGVAVFKGPWPRYYWAGEAALKRTVMAEGRHLPRVLSEGQCSHYLGVGAASCGRCGHNEICRLYGGSVVAVVMVSSLLERREAHPPSNCRNHQMEVSFVPECTSVGRFTSEVQLWHNKVMRGQGMPWHPVRWHDSQLVKPLRTFVTYEREGDGNTIRNWFWGIFPDF